MQGRGLVVLRGGPALWGFTPPERRESLDEFFVSTFAVPSGDDLEKNERNSFCPWVRASSPRRRLNKTVAP